MRKYKVSFIVESDQVDPNNLLDATEAILPLLCDYAYCDDFEIDENTISDSDVEPEVQDDSP